jgi:hypothetical protein
MGLVASTAEEEVGTVQVGDWVLVEGPRPTLSLAVNGRQNRRFRPSFTAGLKAAGAVTSVHSLIDPAAIRRFWDLGIGVYSDEPFPPLDEAAPMRGCRASAGRMPPHPSSAR